MTKLQPSALVKVQIRCFHLNMGEELTYTLGDLLVLQTDIVEVVSPP